MKLFKVFIFMILIVCLCGCFNYKEINNYAIVSGISIDIDPNNKDNYQVGLQIMNAKKNKEDNNSLITTYKASAKTIYQALEKIMLDSPKELYLGHNEVIVISEELLKNKDPLDYLDFFLRDSRIEKDSLVINARNEKAYDVLEIITPLETIPSSNLKSSLNIADNYSGTLSLVTIDEFISDLKIDGKQPVLPSVIIIGKKDDGENMDNIKESNPKAKLKFTTLAYFKNNKLYGYLNNDESTGYNLLTNDVKETYINVKCDDENYASLRVDNANIKDKISFINNKPIISINVSAVTNILEYNCKTNFITDENSINKLEELTKKRVNSLMKKAVNKLYKENKSDALGYGYKFYSRNFKEMKKLGYTKNTVIDDIKFNFNTKIRINSTSLSIKSIKEN